MSMRPIQDAVSLAVVNGLDVSTKILACVGFRAEADEGVCHYRALENMAALAGNGSFLGACALTQVMPSFQYYKTICEAIFEQGGDISHIHTRVIPAVDGEFGQFQRYRHAAVMLMSPRPPFLSPLMSVFWFFDVAGVAARSLLTGPFAAATTYGEVRAVYDQIWETLGKNRRPNKDIPFNMFMICVSRARVTCPTRGSSAWSGTVPSRISPSNRIASAISRATPGTFVFGGGGGGPTRTFFWPLRHGRARLLQHVIDHVLSPRARDDHNSDGLRPEWTSR